MNDELEADESYQDNKELYKKEKAAARQRKHRSNQTSQERKNEKTENAIHKVYLSK